ncbi:transposase [Cereibacter sphaeroides]|jgi:transposase|uniref:transposase n=1 Tax=Cereibacter sphaeroides TaxID=1063 RepID=UPI0000663F18
MGEGYVGSFQILDEPMGRRTWPDEEKLWIVMASYVPGMRVGDVVRKYRLLPSQLTTWRRMAREGRFGLPEEAPGFPETAEFVPLMVDAAPRAPRVPPDERIEIEAGGVTIRVSGSTPAARVAEIAAALGRGADDHPRPEDADRDRHATGGLPLWSVRRIRKRSGGSFSRRTG